MGNIGQVRETQRFRFLVKRQIGHALSLEFHHPHLVEQGCRKVGSHEGFVLLGQRYGGSKVVLALLPQVGGNPIDDFAHPLFAGTRARPRASPPRLRIFPWREE